MNALQGAKFKMYRTVELVCSENRENIDAVVAVGEAFEEFQAIIEEIDAATLAKISTVKGATAVKRNFKETLCKKMSVYAGVVYSYGADAKNHTLTAKMNFSYTALKRLKSSELAPFCQGALNNIAENLAALADYNITQTTIDELQTAIDNYKATAVKPRSAIIERKYYVAKLIELFKQGDALLYERLDKLMKIFEDTHPDFYNTYRNAREIIDARTTTTQLKGKITSQTDNTPIEAAQVTILELEKTFKTKPTGRYLFKPIPNGKYTIQITAEGFADFQAENIVVKQGVINRLNVELTSE